LDTLNVKFGKALLYTAGGVGVLSLGTTNPAYTAMTTTFALSTIVGYHTIWSIHLPLVSPLMSFNVAISGIEAIGGLYLMGGGYLPSNSLEALSAAAVFFSFVNISGGLAASGRMLDAYRRPQDVSEYKPLYGLIAGSLLSFYTYAATHDYPEIHKLSYLLSSLFCVGAIAGLTKHSTSRNLTAFGLIGLSGGIVTSISAMNPDFPLLSQMAAVAASGTLAGILITKSVDVTRVSPLVAAYHSLVGVAAVLTCFATYASHYPHFGDDPATAAHKIAIFLSTFIGGITISGSAMAYGKIIGALEAAPKLIPGRHALNAGLVAANSAALAYFMSNPSYEAGIAMLSATAALSTIMGVIMALNLMYIFIKVNNLGNNSIRQMTFCLSRFS